MNQKEHQKINDNMRQKMDIIYFSKSIQAYNDKDLGDIMNKVKHFKSFSIDNDPHKVHDFGIFMHNGEKICWKIETRYPQNIPCKKYLVIMKASEY